MTDLIHLDFETRSRVNLLTDGAYNYALDDSTEVICMCWAYDNEPIQKVHLWVPGDKWEIGLYDLADHIRDGGMIAAHNAAFERLIFDYVMPRMIDDFPVPKLEQYICTATQARANALPGQLGDLCRALNLAQLKQSRGFQLIKLLSIPQDDGAFNKDPDLLGEMYDYCAQDVRAEREAHSKMRPLTTAELEDYWISERVNDRGLRIDLPLAKAAVAYADAEAEAARAEVERLTNGAVKKVRGEGLKLFVRGRLSTDEGDYTAALDAMSVAYKNPDGTEGVKYTLDRNARTRLLELPADDLPPLVRQIVEATDSVSNSSVGKFASAISRADAYDQRVCGAYVCFGAGQTHRFSSRGLQLHNFPRQCMPEPETTRTMLVNGLTADKVAGFYDLPITTVLSRMLRPMLIPADGHSYVVGDWSGIEARGLPWLSGDPRAEEVLDVFRSGEDIYVREARNLPGQDRQLGKVAVLSLGYGGGVGAFQSMAKNYGVSITDEAADQIKRAWRLANPWAPDFWKACETAALRACRNPGLVCDAGRLQYMFTAEMLGGVLWCLLPNGRMINYPGARVDVVDGRFGPQSTVTCMKASVKPKAGETEWPRMGLWGGLLAENATQALCGGVLRDAMWELDELSAPLVGHTHDELILEVPDAGVDRWTRVLQNVMDTIPDWADGLPLDAELWSGKRYRK